MTKSNLLDAIQRRDFTTFLRILTEGAREATRRGSDATRRAYAIHEKAAEVFGSKADGEAWLREPAIGLNGTPSIKLLDTPEGCQAVEVYLTQIEYGVYR
jgi:putative toxin-antitoxin system antitoxin component (TIGR02293 family)